MGSFGRAVGVLGLTVAGSLLAPAGFATFGAALGSFAGGLLFGQQGPTNSFRLTDLEGETLDYGAPRNRFFGQMKTTAVPIDARQQNGMAQALEERKTTQKKGGLFGIGGTKITSYTYYLWAAYYLGDGQYEVERIYFEDGKGKKLIYNRSGADADTKGYTLHPVYDAGGRLVGETCDGLELWRGFATQPASPYLLTQHGGQVPAYRGKSYLVMKGRKLTDGQGKVVVVMRELNTGGTLATNTRGHLIEQTFTGGGLPLRRLWIQDLNDPISSHSTGGGAVLAGTSSRAEFLTNIALLGLCDLPQVDGVIQDRPRQSPLYHVIQLDEMGARAWDAGSGHKASEADVLKIQPVNVRELPSSLRIQFQDINLDYATNYAVSRRESAVHENEQSLTLPIASTLQEMQWLCDTLLDEAWAARATVEVTFLPSRVSVAVGDILLLPDDGDPLNPVVHSVRVTEQTLSPEGLVACKGQFYDGGVYGQFRPVDQVALPLPVIEAALAPVALVFDVPALTDEMVSTSGVMVAACAPSGTFWDGAVWQLQNGPASVPPLLLDAQSPIGTVLSGHTFLASERGQVVNATLRIPMIIGTLAPSASDAALALGANLLLIQGSDAGGAPATVCLQFRDALPVAGNASAFNVSGLIVGYGASDALSFAANAPCLLLFDEHGVESDGILWADLPLSLRGQTLACQVATHDGNARTDGTHSLIWNAETQVARSPLVDTAKYAGEGLRLTGRARTRYTLDHNGLGPMPARASEPRFATGNKFTLSLSALGQTQSLDLVNPLDGGAFSLLVPLSQIVTLFGAMPWSVTGTLAEVGALGSGHTVSFSVQLNALRDENGAAILDENGALIEGNP